MSLPTSSSNGCIWGAWTAISPYVTPPVAAAAAIVPVFYGFVMKSAQQQGDPIPRMKPMEAIKQGCKAAPTVGVIVGTQMVAQNIIESLLGGTNKEKSSSFVSMLMSSMIVGAISSPALAVMNGQTMGRSIQASLRALSAKQVVAIVTRETSFLFSLRISTPVSETMKQICGDNPAVDYGATFVSGAIGSVIGHPADTALTLWQKNRKIKSARQLMGGAPVKAIAVGGFAMGYKGIKSILESIK